MKICHAHNLNVRESRRQKRFGIRVTLPSTDPFRRVLGEEWQKFHWYETPAQRDQALAEFSKRHMYSRVGDRPSLVFEKIERN